MSVSRAAPPGDAALVDLAAAPPDKALLCADDIADYVRDGTIPWRRGQDGETIYAATTGMPENMPHVRVGRASFDAALEAAFAPQLLDAAVNGLRRTRPEYSAERIVTRSQGFAFAGLGALIVAAGIAAPLSTLIALNTLAAAYFITALSLRLYLCVGASHARAHAPEPDPPEWPVITILAPLYHEAGMLPGLVRALGALDYPAERLDVKIILEADDEATCAAARRMSLPGHFSILCAPPCAPRTKPKALNYALHFARGAYVAVYDAEDRPEPDQLKKAMRAFSGAQRTGDAVGCVQARLNFYNAGKNWLTRQFASEYAQLFDNLSPALDRRGWPAPLGGTSNVFRKAALEAVGGWDPFNVTEDADVGLRLAAAGYRIRMIDSTTYEEATANRRAWTRQRTRWIKGHLQTWLVHMRAPVTSWRRLGPGGFAVLQLIIGGNVFNALINPLFWSVFLAWLLAGPQWVERLFPPWLAPISMTALLFGNFTYVYLALVAPMKRRWHRLAPYALTAPAYWLAASLAGYLAVFDLLRRPSYWAKTAHAADADA